jgi:uncharacterized protein YjbJ (UPF0337 family)
MDNDRVIGAGEQIAGAAKQAIGGLVGDVRLQAGGESEQTEGTIQNIAGSAKDTLRGQ